MAAVRRDAHERLGHEAGKRVELPTDLPADLTERRQVVGRPLGPVEAEVQLELSRRVLVISLDHVEAHRLAVLDHPVDQGLELGELVDVVAVGLRHALDRGRSVLVQLEPHHLGLGSGTEVEARLRLELRLDPLQVPAAVRAQEGAGVTALLAVSEARAPDPGGLLVPRHRHEGLGLREEHELGGLGAVADVVRVTVGEEVRGRAVDELQALLGHPLPVHRRDALTHDPAGDGDELVVDVLDSLGVDPPTDLGNLLVSPRSVDKAVKVGRHLVPPSFSRARSRRAPILRRGGGYCQAETAVGATVLPRMTPERRPRIESTA